MTTPKILIPQALNSIKAERNFFLYQIVDMGPGKKPSKVPGKIGAPYIAMNTDRAARHTLEEIVELVQTYNASPERIEKHNANRREWAEKNGGVYRAILRYAVGYVPRAGSGAVVVDIDDCVLPGGEVAVDDFELAALVDEFTGYKEVSTSGTGLRILMPRGFGDEELSDRREANGCAFMAREEQAKGFALTLTGGGEFERSDELVAAVCRVRDAGLRERVKEAGDVDPLALSDAAIDFLEYSIDDLRSMLAAVPNEGYDRDAWIGLMKAVREAFEPRGLGEAAFDVFDEWTASSEDHGYDPDHNRARWEERLDPSSKRRTTLASILKVARENGWSSEAEKEAEGREEERTLEEIDRYVLVDGKFFDAWKARFLDASQMWRISIDWKMPGIKGNKNQQNARLGWLASNLLRFDDIDFDPGEGRILSGQFGEELNTWAPPRLDFTGEGSAQAWVDHVMRLYPEDGETLIEWLAFVLQNPGRKVGWAPVLIGPEGSGKDTILWPITKALAEFANPEVKLSTAAGQFGDWLYRKLLCVIQENTRGKFSDKAAVAEQFKTLIAAPPDTITIEPKGFRVTQIKNVVNVAFLMNHVDAIYIEPGSRRYFPMITDEKPDARYFGELWGWLKDGEEGWREVAAMLLRKRLRVVHERMDAPISSGLEEVVAENLPRGADKILAFVYGRQWVTVDQIKGAIFAEGFELSGQAIGRILRSAGFSKVSKSGSSNYGRLTVRYEDRVAHYVIYAKPNIEVPFDIFENNPPDSEELDKLQLKGHLRLV